MSSFATDASGEVWKYVCRAIVTLLSIKPEYHQNHMLPVSQFMLTATDMTANGHSEVVVRLRREFWLIFASLNETRCTPAMMDAVQWKSL